MNTLGRRASLIALLFAMTSTSLAIAEQEAAKPASDLEKAAKLFEARDYAAAAVAYAEITKSDPNNGLAWHHLGYSLHTLGRLDEALVAHEKAAQSKEFKALGWYNVACVYALKNKPDEAFKALNTAIDAGLKQPGQIDADEDFKLIRNDPRFAAALDHARQVQQTAASKLKTVAIVVHEGVELLDFAGPAEVFANARKDGENVFKVFTVAPQAEPVDTQQGVRVMPQYSIENCPKFDILIIPGGATQKLTRDPAFMAWVKRVVPDTEITMSVCTGAFTLADNQLLDGLEATTHFSAINGLRKSSDKIKVREGARWCDNGKIITTAGISAGIDGALHVVARLCGDATAKETAKNMEYDWRLQDEAAR